MATLGSLRVRGTASDVTLLLVLLTASLGLNVYFGVRWRPLPPAAEPPPTLALGETVPPLEARTLEGLPQQLTYADQGKPTVIYAFSATCPWCRKNLANIKHLFREKQGQYRFLGIAPDDKQLAAYVADNALPFPVYTRVPEAVLRRYKLGGVPQTLVISEAGTVLRNWHGAYSGDAEAEIESFFSVQLPGLDAAGATASLH